MCVINLLVYNVVCCRFGQLQQADVSGIEPAVRADINANNVLRDDVAQEFDSRHVASAHWCLLDKQMLHKLLTV